MALRINKQSRHPKLRTFVSLYLVGLACIVAPLSQATAVHSPAKRTSRTSASLFDRPISCSTDQPMRSRLAQATSLHLQKLSEYEAACRSNFITTMSFFVPTPTTNQEANEYAIEVAQRLQEFAEYNVKPLVFLEPTTPTGLIDMAAYQAGAYDEVLNTYFAAIKNAGITDEMMGAWVPFPEGNLPVWTNVEPEIFAACVTKTITLQKEYFPESKASILLDSVSYSVSGSWENGEATSLLPYLQTIPRGLIDSFGLQGFPWVSPANEGAISNGTPDEYLRSDLARDAANSLGVKDIWFNTGTFATKYAASDEQRIVVSPSQRRALLGQVVRQVSTLQSNGYAVAVHLFAENKANVPEATDWSYLPTDTDVLKTFVGSVQALGVPIWLFDTK